MLFNAGFLDRVKRAARAIILCSALSALFPFSAIAATSVSLAWNPSAGPDIAGYKIYYGAASLTYTNTTDVGNATNATVANLISGTTYFFAATAYDTSGLESDYSAEVVYTNQATVTITNVPPPLPSIALTSPANGDSYTEPATINLAAGVNANGHTITKVQFYNGATLLAEETAAPYAITWTSVSAGNYSLTALAVYDSGSTVASSPATVVLVAAGRPVNTPPAISAIVGQTMTANSPQRSVRFTIGDTGSDESNLALYASSTNPALLPCTNIILTNSDTNCTVKLIPVPGQTGEVDITITVSNVVSSLTANTTFHLSITEQVAWNLWWQHSSGYTALWMMDGTNATKQTRLNAAPAAEGWSIVGTGDFIGDGQTDLLWQSASGWVALWLMDGTNRTGGLHLNTVPVDPGWKVVGTGDFDGDGHTDILWQSASGWVALWLMNGTNCTRTMHLNTVPVDPGWKVVGTADIFGDGNIDIVWRNELGTLAYWQMNGTNFIRSGRLNPAWADPSWEVVGPK